MKVKGQVSNTILHLKAVSIKMLVKNVLHLVLIRLSCTDSTNKSVSFKCVYFPEPAGNASVCNVSVASNSTPVKRQLIPGAVRFLALLYQFHHIIHFEHNYNS